MDPRVVFCPRCDGRLMKLFAIEEDGVPHGKSGHKLVFRYTVISRCSGCDHAIVESFDHDCFSMDLDEPGDGWGWGALAPDQADRLRATACPSPTWPACRCEVHESLQSSRRRLGLRFFWSLPPPGFTDEPAGADLPRVRVELRDGLPFLVTSDAL